jgi:diguanylate cyclase (GGDEF)-like protein/PAS domain S-box-containing protein
MPTPISLPRILLIEDDPAAADEIRVMLDCLFDVQWASRLSEGIACLSKKETDAVVLNLSLPDSHGIETFDRLFVAARHIPILILSGDDNESLAKQAVGRGALDYLPPNRLDSYSLPRALRNAIHRKTVEDALYAEKERALMTLNSIGDAVLCTDAASNVTSLNLVAEKMTGWSSEEARGQPLAAVYRIDGSAAQDIVGDCVLIRRDGLESFIEDSVVPLHDQAGCVVGTVIVFHDVSKVRAMSRQITHAAQHDVVTNLPNRMLLNDRIAQSISLARRRERLLAVILLDLDRFKYINDSLGHAIGDNLLQSVSKRLLASLRCSDTVSRQGGDEFVILLSEIADPTDVAITANKILLLLNAPHAIGGQDLVVGGSLGISIYPVDGEDAQTLIKNADTAMYRAKERGRNNFQFFEQEMNLKVVERQSLEGGLRRAFERKEFLLHYQPKVNLDTGKITGSEALIRWQHPDRGLVPPSQFIPIAEDCGLILEIGCWVLREACSQARAWQNAGLLPLPVAINVSAVEFRDKGFVQRVRAVLSETGLEARYLELELTESVLVDDVESMASVLRDLKMMGIHLAVDDFGTGYSSLSYLRQFPIDVLKIDQSFVHQISDDPYDCSIVSAIISIAKGLKHVVVAEGVETREQWAYLQAQHCAEGQGNLFSRPLGALQFAHLITAA